MNQLFQKPKDVRYTDMCIWIDKHIYEPDVDLGLAFKYMYLLAYMFQCQARYFHKEEDYDRYAFYLANSTFQRYKRTDKVKLKSVKNYMKSIMYFRKVQYLRESMAEVIDPEWVKTWDTEKYTRRQIQAIEQNDSDVLKMDVSNYLSTIPGIIKNCIPERYKKDQLVYKNLYISSILSFLSRVTLTTNKEKYLEEKGKPNANFDQEKFYSKHLNQEEIILWHLPKDYEDTVKIILNKSKTQIQEAVEDIQSDYKISDKEYMDLQRQEIFQEWDQNEVN